MKKALSSFSLLLFYCAISQAQAQPAGQLTGTIYVKNSPAMLANTLISNTRTNAIASSNNLGMFTIGAALGDTLQFSKANFLTTRQVVTTLINPMIFMVPVTQLNEVTIKGQTTKQQLDDAINTYRSKGLYFDGKPPLIIFNPISGSPVTGFYELFSKDARQIRHFIKYANAEQAAAHDQARFNKHLIKAVTQLPDTELQKFIDTYQPPHQDLIKWTDYELIEYINQSLSKYKRFGAQPLQKLTAP